MQRSRGLTLIELCFAMAIVAVLAGMAAPGFRASMRAAAVRAATYELLAGLQQARGNSIVELRPGVLCPSNAAGKCRAAAAPSTFWRSSIESNDAVDSFEVHALPAGVQVRASRSPLRFWPDSLGATTSTLTICDAQAVAPPRAIVLSISGRARVASAAATACR